MNVTKAVTLDTVQCCSENLFPLHWHCYSSNRTQADAPTDWLTDWVSDWVSEWLAHRNRFRELPAAVDVTRCDSQQTDVRLHEVQFDEPVFYPQHTPHNLWLTTHTPHLITKRCSIFSSLFACFFLILLTSVAVGTFFFVSRNPFTFFSLRLSFLFS